MLITGSLIALLKVAGVANVAKKVICDEPVNPISAQHAVKNVAEFVNDKLGDNDVASESGGLVESVADSCDGDSLLDIFNFF